MTIEEQYLNIKRQLFEKAYSHLNERQREAVFTVNGPLLVLAGAGSGKTTVLVQRIAFLIRYGNAYYSDYVPFGTNEETVDELKLLQWKTPEELRAGLLDRFANHPAEPYRVLAITFTNKAAKEMRERLHKMFPEREEIADQIVNGTFHSFCVRILRQYGDAIGYKPGFTIYDADDQKKVVVKAMERCNIDEKQLDVKSVANAISRAKDKLQTPDDFAEEHNADFRMGRVARIYEAYQQILRENNALDFDDLIMQTVLLFRTHEEIRKHLSVRFRYISVDEYQDTNVAQFELCRLLSADNKNLMVVGDDDQSIYRFRGATVENILDFDRVYPDATVIKLEENYRSTKNILDAANAVIAKNKTRKGKNLWTAKVGGNPITLVETEDQNEEGNEILRLIREDKKKNNRKFSDYAILYRTNAQSNSLEKIFARTHPAVPYRILGGTRFSDRKEIRDVVAYLQLIANHNDNIRLNRIINEPKRKIGATTMDAVAQLALEKGVSQFEIMQTATFYPALSRTAPTLVMFADMIEKLTEMSDGTPLDVLFDQILDKTGYRQMLVLAGETEKERLENLEEFKSNIVEYMQGTEKPTLQGFLEETALIADVDRYDESADAVVMMTIHSAKGLEFPVVFLPGMEDGLFPGMQSIEGGEGELEEERRLAYVAITRAQKDLYILHTRQRLLYGHTTCNLLSRFVSDIPENLLTKKETAGFHSENGGSRYSYADYDEYRPHKRNYLEDFKQHPSDAERISVGFKTSVVKKPTKSHSLFQPGDRVRHATFGEGEILTVMPMGADTLYEIVFDTVGTKKLMATYAKLEKI